VGNGAADYVNQMGARRAKVIARVIAGAIDGRDLQIRIGGNPHTDAG